MYKIIKRIIDVVASLSIIILMLPIILLIAIIIYLHDLHNPIYSSTRVGENAVPFLFHKFRSMHVGTLNVESNETEKLQITTFGKFIRRTNLDEIPQLINILKGEMSLIGPRPPIPSQSKLIDLRLENGAIHLKPGLTGWAQVNSYDNMPYYEKASLDGYYYKNISFVLDIKIVYKTLIYLTKKPPVY